MDYSQIKKIGVICHAMPEDENKRIGWPADYTIFETGIDLPYQVIVDPEIQRFTNRAIGSEENKKLEYDQGPFSYNNFLQVLLDGHLVQLKDLGYSKKTGHGPI